MEILSPDMEDTAPLAEILGFRRPPEGYRPGSVVPRNRSRQEFATPDKKEKHQDCKASKEKDFRVSKKNKKRIYRSIPDGNSHNHRSFEEEIASRFSKSPKKDWMKKHLPQKNFENGDIVWAKAFPYTWWPGRIDRIKNSSALVSFYGCAKRQWFRVHEIRGFEENYSQMSKMIGMKFSANIDLALEELSWRTAFGLMCFCQNSAAEATGMLVEQTAQVRKGFESTEILGFVLDVAVSAWVENEEKVTAIRVSAQVGAYRHYVSACQNSEVDVEFCPADLLDFVLDVAVSLSIDDYGSVGIARAVKQLDAYRQFVSVCPNWLSWQTMGTEDSSLGDETKGTDQGIFDSSSKSAKIDGETIEPGYDFSVITEEEDLAVFEEQVLEGRETCMINRVDFSILNLDEEYKCLLDNQLEAVADRSVPTGADICMDENFEMQNSSTGVSLEEMDAETICKKSFSPARDVHQISADETRFYANERSIDSLHCCAANIFQENSLDFAGAVNVVQSGKCLTCDDNPGTTLGQEKVKQEDDISIHVEHQCDDSAAVLVSSVDSSILQTVPAKESRLAINLPNKHEIHSQDETLKFGFDVQCTFEVSLVGSDASTSDTTKVFSSLDLPTRAACKSILKKRRLSHPTTPDNSFKLNKMLDAQTMKYISSSGNQTCSNDEVNAANNATEKALFLHHADSGTKFVSETKDCLVHYEIDEKGCCSLTLPRCEFKNKHHHQEGPDRPGISDLSEWTRYYSSPLMRESSTLTRKVQKSSMSDNYNSFPKSLHMKFPKDFKLPSKEQLEKKFLLFGPLDCSKTKLFFYTGAAQVVFLNQADADSAYRCVKKKNVFGHANVRFWFDKHENFRKGHETHDLLIPVERYSSLDLKSCLKGPQALHERDKKKEHVAKAHDLSTPVLANSSLNLKPCLKSPNAVQGRNGKKTCKVRFTIET
ncbi:uncharacterized protein LOC113461433 [Phoenix dactylifera]|uniref:Uncharacterized protein LOC113461433 n=1 Tax=Phoenix dactylifera TaxID=42345 RepID=A0A8B8ZUH1_PHODC|nr:uncharacterized protein LOC113461433 [Phoenix dactylifera]